MALVVLGAGAAGWAAWTALRPGPLANAQAALDRRDFHAAADILTKHLADRPDDREAWLLAAQASRRGGEFARAREHLTSYTRRFSSDEASELESRLLALQTGNLAGAERLLADSRSRPEAALVTEAYLEGHLRGLAPHPGARLDPDRDDGGVVTRLRAAADAWLAERRNAADRAQGLVWHGRISEYARDHADAVAKFREAIELDSSNFDARLQLALALGPDAPDESVKHLEALRRSAPEDRRVRFFLATGYLALGRTADARRLLADALADDPDDLNALVELARLDLDEGKPDEAEPRILRAMKRAPNAPEVNIAMSRCQLLAGRPAEAERYRKRFEELDAVRGHPATRP